MLLGNRTHDPSFASALLSYRTHSLRNTCSLHIRISEEFISVCLYYISALSPKITPQPSVELPFPDVRHWILRYILPIKGISVIRDRNCQDLLYQTTPHTFLHGKHILSPVWLSLSATQSIEMKNNVYININGVFMRNISLSPWNCAWETEVHKEIYNVGLRNINLVGFVLLRFMGNYLCI